ncbi:MAG: hypothetical protein BGO54_04055 [Sphingobacteriales bacterium 46-32]|nr:MAG: hypothetical protein BGO54_04055 [Sphingobacteriales bacterium 46-32]
MIRCLIIDDERPAINVLKRYIDRTNGLELIATTTNPETGIELIQSAKPDVVFLDIQMGVIGGMDVAKSIGELTKIIFCTAHFQYAAQSYEVNAVDYLLKPLLYPRFLIAIQKVMDAITGKVTPVEAIADDYILVKDGERGKLHKVDMDDIVFIKALSNYVSIHTTSKIVVAYLSLKELEDRLPASNFVRVQRSYIVCLKQIEEVNLYEIKLRKYPTPIPIGANFKEAFLERIKEKLLPKSR